MRTLVFAARNRRELLRDPLTLAFSIGFPLALLLLFYAIGQNIPQSPFEMGRLAPGVAVFGLSFISLFSSTLIAKDRSSSLLLRLFTTPLTARDFLLGYTLPLLPIAVAQSALCLLAAFCLGLPVHVNALLALAVLLPAALLFIALGLLLGTLLNDKQAGGVCGALLTNLSAFLSGAWLDLSLIGGAFERFAYALPFAHAVDAARAALEGDFAAILPHLCWVLAYALAILAAACLLFRRKMSRTHG